MFAMVSLAACSGTEKETEPAQSVEQTQETDGEEAAEAAEAGTEAPESEEAQPAVTAVTEAATEVAAPETETATEAAAPETEAATEAAEPETETVADEGSQTQVTYILNTNTKRFHLPGCSSVDSMKDSNREDVNWSRDAVIDAGYVPCKRCNP